MHAVIAHEIAKHQNNITKKSSTSSVCIGRENLINLSNSSNNTPKIGIAGRHATFCGSIVNNKIERKSGLAALHNTLQQKGKSMKKFFAFAKRPIFFWEIYLLYFLKYNPLGLYFLIFFFNV
jgi:hypothetical protein